MLVMVSLLGTACSKEALLSEHVITARHHLEEMGFDVESIYEEGTYQVTKEDWESIHRAVPHEEIWSVQEGDVDDYMGKVLATVSVRVKNHPLDDAYNIGHTRVTVLLDEGQVIGGWTVPVSKDRDVIGGVFSLSGK